MSPADKSSRFPPLVGAALLLLAFLPAGAAAGALDPIVERIAWGENSARLARDFAPSAVRVTPPIEFGDSVVDVAIPGERIGATVFTLYFQMDKGGRGLKRIMLERQRHGANPAAFRAVIAALAQDYGPPALSCENHAASANGYQASSERRWLTGGIAIRALLRGTTLEAAEGCVRPSSGACGLAAQLFVQIMPRAAAPAGCA